MADDLIMSYDNLEDNDTREIIAANVYEEVVESDIFVDFSVTPVVGLRYTEYELDNPVLITNDPTTRTSTGSFSAKSTLTITVNSDNKASAGNGTLVTDV